MLRTALRPGTPVPQTKIFWVHHYQHRLVHLAKVLFDVFPQCARCGDRVRYEAAIVPDNDQAESLGNDRDFQHALGDTGFRSLGAAARRRPA